MSMNSAHYLMCIARTESRATDLLFDQKRRSSSSWWNDPRTRTGSIFKLVLFLTLDRRCTYVQAKIVFPKLFAFEIPNDFVDLIGWRFFRHITDITRQFIAANEQLRAVLVKILLSSEVFDPFVEQIFLRQWAHKSHVVHDIFFDSAIRDRLIFTERGTNVFLPCDQKSVWEIDVGVGQNIHGKTSNHFV